jgi:hypothetical protein
MLKIPAVLKIPNFLLAALKFAVSYIVVLKD